MRPDLDAPAGRALSREVATLWSGVYTESLSALEGASMRMSALVVGHRGYARQQVERADLTLVLQDLDHARERLFYWNARLAALN